MRVFRAAAVMALLAAPAYAQSEHVPKYGEADPEKSQQQIESDRSAERAYKSSLSNIPDKGPSDPWGNVRTDGSSKDVAKALPSRRAKPAAATN
jgi:hypothetical protein